MITLYQGPTAWGIPNISPFCTKLEAYLRMAELPYETKPGDPRRAPTGKIPYIDLDGQRLGDSQQIVEALVRKYGDKIDAHLTAEQRARGHLIRRAIEEGLYYVLVHARWGDENGWRVYQPIFLSLMPKLIGRVVVPMIRKQVIKRTHGQGTGRHPQETIYAMGKADLDAIAAELGDKPWIFGEKPSSVDAVIYAFISGILAFPADSALKRHAAALPQLVAHYQRFQQLYFPADRPPGRS